MTPLSLSLVGIFIQVAITFVTLFRLGCARVGSVRKQEVHIRDVAVDKSSWSTKIKQLQNNFSNQFELPVLFYLAIVIAILTDSLNWWVAIAGAAFVATRVAHNVVHTGSNRVSLRFRIYFLGFVCLVACWIFLGLSLLTNL